MVSVSIWLFFPIQIALGLVYAFSMKAADRPYHPFSVLIHWAVVLSVVVCFGTIMVALRLSGADPWRPLLIKTHIISGQLLFLFNLIRLSIFSAFGTPVPDGLDFHQVHAMRFLHALLYGAVGFLACTGSLLALAYAAGQTVLGWQVPMIMSPLAMASVRELHGTVSVIFIFIALVHAGASLAMHYFSGRSTLAKMRIRGSVVDYITSPGGEKGYLRLDAPTMPAETPSKH